MDPLSQLDDHALVPEQATYARLGVLAPAEALRFDKRQAARWLRSPDAVAVPILRNGALQALAVAHTREDDSRAFGRRIGEVCWLSLDATLAGAARRRLLAELLAECRLGWRARFDLVTALVDADRTEDLEALQHHGARVHGANSTWVAPLAQVDQSVVSDPRVERASLWDGPPGPLVECVRASFEDYRSHYHADGRLAPDAASGSYVTSVERHLARGGRTVAVEREGRVAGFGTLDPTDELNDFAHANLAGEMTFNGVVPAARRQGIYESILRAGLHWFKGQGFGFFIIGCRADNFAVQRAWARLGALAPRRLRWRLHWWIGS